MDTGVPGPWIGAGGPTDPKARLQGGWRGLDGRLEPGVVMGALEVEMATIGDVVPATEVPETPSVAKTSPGVEGTLPPRSIKRDRNFFSRTWMSSGLPWDSEDTSHLRGKRDSEAVISKNKDT